MTRDEMRRRHPHLTEEELDGLEELHARKPQLIEEIWESENDVRDPPQECDADGFTRPMRELNRFAEEHALPVPFPVKPRKVTP